MSYCKFFVLCSATSSQISEAAQLEKDISPSPTEVFQTTNKQEEEEKANREPDKRTERRKEEKHKDRRKEDKQTDRRKEDMVRIYNPPTSLNSRQLTPNQSTNPSFGANGFKVSLYRNPN